MAIQQETNGLRELALFAGAGGGILGGKLLGWRTVCAVEWDAYAASVLVARQNDGCLPPFPIWDDVQTFDGRPWRGRVEVVSGGFPCQDISAAGKGAGIDGERSGMWGHMARIVGEVRPQYVFVENAPTLVRRGLARVLSDLAQMGYDARWGIVGAHHVSAPHKRERMWIVAHSKGGRGRKLGHGGREKGLEGGNKAQPTCSRATQGDFPDTEGEGLERHWDSASFKGERSGEGHLGAENCQKVTWWETEPSVGRVVDELANRLDRLKCLGNGQVSSVAALAWEILSKK